jgi:cell fate (sporulation/competence/biofilm development) regulator YmcA (YheA/YmcA/DUF963 family)
MVITRKVQLFFDCDKSELDAMYKKWRDWQYIVRKAANMIVTTLYTQDQHKSFFYYTEAMKLKLADVRKDEDGILTMSRDNTTYQLLSRAFKGACPMGMLSGLNTVVCATYKKEAEDVAMGKRSLRVYRNTIPMPVRSGDISNIEKLEDGNYRFHVYGTWFKTWFGRDLSGNELIFDGAQAGQYKLCDSSISFDDSKIFFNAVFRMDPTPVKLDKKRELIAHLSPDAPIVFSFRNNEYKIGYPEEFKHRLEQIRAGRKRAVVSARYNKKGRGRKKRLESVDRYEKYAEKYVQSKIHMYTAKLINFAIKLKCGKITLAPVEDGLSKSFVFPSWSYGGLSDKLKYKCNKYGIELHGINKKTKKSAVPE